MDPARSDPSIDRGPTLPPPVEERELALLAALVYPRRGRRCPCRCGKLSAHVLHLIALDSRTRPDGTRTRTPTQAELAAYEQERDPETGRHPTRPLVEHYDAPPDVGLFRAFSEVGTEGAFSLAVRDDIPNPPRALWAVSSVSCGEVIETIQALGRRKFVERRSCEAGRSPEFRSDLTGSYLDCIVRATKAGKEALDANREWKGIEPEPEELVPVQAAPARPPDPRSDDDLLDLDDANGLTYGEARVPVTYSRGKRAKHQMTFEMDAESQCVANALVEWVRLKERPRWASSKIVSYIRDAFGKDAIEGRGKNARLAVSLRLSTRLRGFADSLADHRRTGRKFPRPGRD